MRRLAAVLLLSGCASMPPDELAWQALHAVDTAQTVQIARSTCYWEEAPGTEQLIGHHPSTAGALTWGIGSALAHWGVSAWLTEHGPHWARPLWNAVTIGRTAYYVKNNHDQGIGLTGTDC